MRKLAFLVAVLGIAMLVGFLPENAHARTEFVTIGTGGVTGVYYPTGGAIAKIVNKKKAEYGIRATVESTGGSVFNVNAILAGDLEFGVVQSDRQYQAYKGLAEWKDRGPQEKIRAVFSIHPEPVNLVAAVDAGINELSDLKGKVVNIGNPGSGQLQNSKDALSVAGLDFEKDITAEYVKAPESPSLLQDGRIDAYFYTVGHPNGNMKEATAGRRKVKFVNITGDGLDELLSTHPYYARAEIPMSNYPSAENDGNAVTFGVKATLCTSADVPENVVYAITKEVFENFEEFKKLHPAYQTLTREGMLEGLSAPIHPGAMKYYKEAGLK